ncbi:alpha-1,2-fucosyltransferase [Flavobacterium sp. S87F.05.LMB.W.Kidney.N]|uniref:alpha-1,2-fucosyltransferase n=1 Tax=Flavobacterium sp. S87F.05.LMB.W.Kidney.N TaxID=1278758 RepID=UPI0010666BF7|nr:alpha-1,2-fucosyltransferase [Flavobacterium sp. S87F.05.LMB.W.Kidney.N]TDX09275.1 glycosyl transferase family 11 [Flavobacterium sp. S87F.05.LMB.W.Kidney.N]
MDVVVIFNGLGNQMSQYAFYLQKKKLDKSTRFIFDKRSHISHNGYELERVFNIEVKETVVNSILFLLFRILTIKKHPYFSKPLIKLLNFFGITLFEESANYDFDESLLKSSKGIRFLYGGWHSEKYFESNKKQVLETFKLEVEDVENLSHLEQIKKTESVSIHVRRGDYMKGINFEMYGSVCTKGYFENAIDKINQLVEKPHFFVFSNDLNWVKENFVMDRCTFIDCNNGKDSWKDMYLMSNCKYNVNSNSTFSWWGSYLNTNNSKEVIVPNYFVNNLETKDFYPSNWLKIKDYN